MSANVETKSGAAVVLEHLEELSSSHGEPAELLRARLAARELLEPLVLPERARHLWRYTDPGRFVPKVDVSLPAPSPALPAWRIEDGLAAAAQVEGETVRIVHLDDEARRAGVVIEDLHRAAVDGRLGCAVPAGHGFVEAINSAAWRGGVLLRVPRGVVLSRPIRLRFPAAPGACLPRLLVLAGDGSSFELIEGHVLGDRSSLVLGVSELLLGDGANVRYDLVQRWESGVAGHLTARARLGRGTRLQLSLASFGGTTFKADVGALLDGEGAEAEMYGVAMGGERQHLDHHTEHIHNAGKTRSNLDFKVALTGAARSAYTGMIRIAPHAAGTEAYQVNRNLLLSEDARAESIPELEILTDDVRCSHGATVAPIDEEQLFYLESRGLPHNQAVRLIVYGFLDQTLQRLPEATRERIQAMVADRLHSE